MENNFTDQSSNFSRALEFWYYSNRVYAWQRFGSANLDPGIDVFREFLLNGIINQKLGYLRDTYEDSNVSILKDDSDPKNSGAFDGMMDQFTRLRNPDEYYEVNLWQVYLTILEGLIPEEGNLSEMMGKSEVELDILINNTDRSWSVCDPENVAIKDSVILDLIADYLGNLDGPVGRVLAANPYISEELTADLEESNYLSPYFPTKNLIKELREMRRRGKPE